MWKKQDFCNVTMPSEDLKILEFHQFQKSDKVPLLFYADFDCMIENIDVFKNSPENSSTTKLTKHIPAVFSMSTISSFRSMEKKHDVYRC